MFRILTLSIAAVLVLAACSPAFNWRDVRPDGTRLSLLLPCKPDKAKKTVPLGGQPTALSMLGCDAGGVTFAVAVADLGDAAKVGEALAGWQLVTLANMKAGAGTAQTAPLKVAGASATPAAVRVSASGQRANGDVVYGQAAYFASGTQVFQAVMYAPAPQADVADTFFASLKVE